MTTPTTVPTPAEIDFSLTVLAVLTKRIKEEDERLRTLRRQTLRPGARSDVALTGDGPDAPVDGWVSMTKPSGGGRPTASVRDEQALLVWCREHAQHLVTEHVNTAGQAALIKCALEGGWPDKETGELVPIPGIEVSTTTPGASTLRVNTEDGSWERLLAAVQSGRVDTLKALGGAS